VLVRIVGQQSFSLGGCQEVSISSQYNRSREVLAQQRISQKERARQVNRVIPAQPVLAGQRHGAHDDMTIS